MKLLIMQFSPFSPHFISLRTKYSPQHPVLKQRPSFSPTQNHRRNYNFAYSNFYAFRQQTRTVRSISTLPFSCPIRNGTHITTSRIRFLTGTPLQPPDWPTQPFSRYKAYHTPPSSAVVENCISKGPSLMVWPSISRRYNPSSLPSFVKSQVSIELQNLYSLPDWTLLVRSKTC
jgi:hypothetical protein